MKTIQYLLSCLVVATLMVGCAPANQTTDMTTTAVQNVNTNPTVSDEAAITDLITTLFAATDRRDWSAVASVFADSVIVDYSDLGAERATKSPREIITDWQSMLPGFERTVHQPHNYAVWVAGDYATATLDAIALHYLDGQQWTVFAGYDTEFVKQDGKWKFGKISLSLYDQVGEQDLPQKAMAAVKNGRTFDAPPANGENAQHVDEWLAALERGDVDAYVNYFADDGEQAMPLAPEGFPTSVSGTAQLKQQYAPVGDFISQRYEREIIPTSDPNIVLAKFTGSINVDGENEYNNSYVGMVRFNDAGKITKYTELFNPDILLSGFPGLEQAHYSVHPAGADRDSGVELREVRFTSEGDELVGHVFLPPSFDAGQTYPAVIVTGSWMSIKEQMPDEYASLLAKDGFVTMTFDFRGFGESEGLPRGFESYDRKIEDIRNAATFLLQQPYTKEDLTGLGVCASSGYMAHAVAQDDRFTRLAMIAPWLHNPAMTEELYGSRPGGREGLLKLSREAKQAFNESGELRYDLAVSELNPLAAMYVPGGIFPYYSDPAMAAGPLYANRWAVMSWEPWLTFDAISVAERINVPVHIVHSEKGAVPQGAKSFISKLPNQAEELWLNDYNQMQIYYSPEAVDAAITPTSSWLRKQAL